MTPTLASDYWDSKYNNGETGWDIGYVSTPLKEYFDQITNKNISILIPGCGNAYEAEYLLKNNFGNVFVVDISQTALECFRERVPDFPDKNIFCVDFFDHAGKYDMIIEQTFFCAIHPSMRINYARKVYELLKDNGKLVGLLFDDLLNKDHPPFGGTKEEYVGYFKKHFIFKTFETAYNSISPRADRELFINFLKKS